MNKKEDQNREWILNVVYLLYDDALILFLTVVIPESEFIKYVDAVADHESHGDQAKLNLFTFEGGNVSQFLCHDSLLFRQVV